MPHLSKHYKYVWEPLVVQYHRLGWSLADTRAIYSDTRGEHHTFLMEWLCDCPVVLPSKEPHHAI